MASTHMQIADRVASKVADALKSEKAFASGGSLKPLEIGPKRQRSNWISPTRWKHLKVKDSVQSSPPKKAIECSASSL